MEDEEEQKPDWRKSGSPVEAHPSAVGGGSYGGSQWKSSRSSSEAQEMAEAGSLFRPKEWHPKVPLHKPPFGVKVVGSARSHGGYRVPYFHVKSPSKFHNNSFQASTYIPMQKQGHGIRLSSRLRFGYLESRRFLLARLWQQLSQSTK